MIATEEKSPSRGYWEMVGKGKRLMTVEQWEQFAYCLDCQHQKCSACKRDTIFVSELLRFLPGIDDLELFLEDFPPQLNRTVVRCCSCGSLRHITDWLRDTFWPELEDVPEVEQAALKAMRDYDD